MREIRLYHEGPLLEVILRLDKQVVTRYESLYVAFPFRAAAPEVRVENAGAVYVAGRGQLPGSATDWHHAGDYVAVSDRRRTILVVPKEVPLVQIGDIHTGKWAPRLGRVSGHLYAWVMNNMWFTNFPVSQEGEVTLTWCITTHAGGFKVDRAAAFADAVRRGVSIGRAV